MIYERTEGKFAVSNAAQAWLFSRLHLGQAGPFALVIGAWAFYEGWLTKRNRWSIRESIFHHFRVPSAQSPGGRRLCSGCRRFHFADRLSRSPERS